MEGLCTAAQPNLSTGTNLFQELSLIAHNYKWIGSISFFKK